LAFNGSGVFVRVHDWTTDLAGAVPVTASRMDAEDDGMATGLSTTICRDGQSTTTARIPFAAGTSAAAGTTASVAYSQTNDNNTGLYFPGTDQWGLVAGGTATLSSTATALTATGTLALSGDFAINTNKFTVTAASGNTLVAGTLAVTGASTLTGAVGVTGDFAVNTNKFTVAASSGNTLVAGTLAVTGAATLSSTLAAGNTTITGTLAASGNVAINTDKFTVAAASGNTLVSGTLAVTGASTFTGLMTGRIPLLHVRDEKADNTDGGTFTSGAWRTRTLNTEVTNEISGASLAANQITLPAGTYEIEASAPGFNCGDHKAKLCNLTDTADTLVGTSESAGAANNSNGRSLVRGRFTIAGAKVFELQHRCSSSQATNGLGQGGGFGVVEVYTDVIIRKVV
jgi:hypothetical protein